LELSLVLSEINKKLDLLERKVNKVDELLTNVTTLTEIVAKLAKQVGL
jgi:outer membrane murein-binding lipoprotein Lpp